MIYQAFYQYFNLNRISVDYRRYLKSLKNFQFPLFNILFENKSGLDRYLGKVIQPFLQ